MSELGKRRRESVLERLNSDSEHQRASVYWHNKKWHEKRREYPSAYELKLRYMVEKEFSNFEYEYETPVGWFDAKVEYKGKTYLFDITSPYSKAEKARIQRKREWSEAEGYKYIIFPKTSTMSKMAVSAALIKIRSKNGSL